MSDPQENHSGLLFGEGHRVIYLYGNIDCDTSMRMLRILIMASMAPVEGKKPILLVINSDGGNVNDSLAIVDAINNISCPVDTLSVGTCASGATLLAAAGRKRFTTRNTMFFVHQVQSVSSEAVSALAHIEDSRLLQILTGKIVSIYQGAIKSSVKKIERLLESTKWMTAEEAMKLGLVNIISSDLSSLIMEYAGSLGSQNGLHG